MKDLTKGKPSVLILSFALPVFLANLLQLTYSIVDTRIVGTFLGENMLAAVGSTTTLSNLIIGFLLGLSNGFAIVTAQKFGARDIKAVKKSFAAALIMGVSIALIITAAGLIFLLPILKFLNIPQDLSGEASAYISVIIAGLIATFLYDMCAAVLRAIGDTITPLIILAVSVMLNVAGDIFFVVILKEGVRGAAIATVLAQFIAFVVCAVYMFRKYDILRLTKQDFKGIKGGMFKNMLGGGLSMGFMSSLVNIGSLTLQTAINKLGQDIIVAHTAARKISEIFMIMFTVFGQTMATYCGQNIGGWLVHLVTGSSNYAVIKNATDYLKFDSIFYYVTAVICIVRNAMQGLGEHITPLVSSSLEMIGKIIIAATLVPVMGYTGVILAEPIVWFIMVIPLLIKIYRMPVLKENY